MVFYYLKNKTMKKISIILFIVIISMLAFNLLTINSEFFLMLFNTWDIIEFPIIKTIFLALGYSLATLYIMFFFTSKNKIFEYSVKLLFPIIDGLIVYIFFNSSITNFAPYLALAYGIFTVLILFFVSETGKKMLKSDNKQVEKPLKDMESELKELKEYNETLEKTIESERIDLNLYRDIIILGIEKQLANLKMKKEMRDYKNDISKLIENMPELKQLMTKINYNEKA